MPASIIAFILQSWEAAAPQLMRIVLGPIKMVKELRFTQAEDLNPALWDGSRKRP